MSDYMRVDSGFWNGDTGRAIRELGPECQVLAMYLITSPHASPIGLYRLPIAYVCNDTGLTMEGASKALRCLSEVQFAAYDTATETVWLPEMAKHQLGLSIGEKDKRFRWVHKEAERMVKSPFFAHFVQRYGSGYMLPFEAPSEVLPSPFDGPSKVETVQQTANSKQQTANTRARAGTTRLDIALADERVVRILAGYRQLHGKDERWKFDTKEEGVPRAVMVLNALEGANGRDQYTEAEIVGAIRANKADTFCAGIDKHEIEYIFRNTNLQRFAAQGRRMQAVRQVPEQDDELTQLQAQIDEAHRDGRHQEASELRQRGLEIVRERERLAKAGAA